VSDEILPVFVLFCEMEVEGTMNHNANSPSVGSADGFTAASEDTAEELYSLYTGLAFRRHFRLCRPCCTVSLKNIARFLLTNVVVSVIVIVLVLGASLGLGLYAVLRVKPQPVIDFSLKAFAIPNHEVTRHQEAFDVAAHEYMNWHRARSRRSVDKRSASRTQYYRRHKVILVYVAVGDDDDKNIFTRERIETIHRIETNVIHMPEFADFCFKDYSQQRVWGRVLHCDSLNSIVSKYFYQSSSVDDATNDQLVVNFDATVRAVLSSPFDFLYTDGHANQTFFESTFLKSELSFGMPLPGYNDVDDRREEQEDKFDQFLVRLVGKLSHLSTEKVQVLYGGTDVFDYEVSSAFWHDIRLALISVVTIIILMFILMSFSIWLTFWGFVTIVLSFPLAYFFYRVVFNVVALGMLNGAAAFVVIGIGVDDVFVFVNTFRQAQSISQLSDRMIHTVMAAGKATFFTSFTTAAAFAANIFSSIPAVHDFGLFMTLIVSSCWVLVFVLMPPVINLWSRWFARCESAIYQRIGCWKSCKSCSVADVPDDVANFFNSRRLSMIHHPHGDDDDVGLLQLDSSDSPSHTNTVDVDGGGGVSSGGWDDDDVELLAVDSSLRSSSGYVHWSHRLGGILQLRRSSDDATAAAADDDDDDDALLSLERQLTHSSGMSSYMAGQLTEGCGLNLKLQSIMYHGVALPFVRARWAIIVVFVLMLIASIVSMTHLRHASKPPQLFQPTTNIEMFLDLMANYTTEGIPSLPSDYNPDFLPPLVHPTSTSSVKSTRVTAHARTSQVTIGPSTSTMTASASTLPTSTSEISFTSSAPSTLISSAELLHTTRPHISQQSTRPHAQSQTSSTLFASATSTATSTVTSSAGFLHTVQHTDMFSSLLPSSSTLLPLISHSVAGHQHVGRHTANVITPPAPAANIPHQIHLEKGVSVYVVFGIKDIDRSSLPAGHVLSEKGTVVYDDAFTLAMNRSHVDKRTVSDLCRFCNIIRNSSELVVANTAQCLPAQSRLPADLRQLLYAIDECRRVPQTYVSDGMHHPSNAKVGLHKDGNIKWLAFSFQSTTFKAASSFHSYTQYQQWQMLIANLRSTLFSNSPLRSVYQTANYWIQVIMEIVAVTSAIYGLVLSMVICIVAVAIFSGHFLLLVITVVTMVGMICLVLAIFYWAGWQLGAIEALCLSILVGSSVDYCLHVVEGFLLSGHSPPADLIQGPASRLRQWRAHVAVTHIGSSVVSSAITTIAASLPLTWASLRPFSRFGQIVAINAAVSVTYSLTVCVALLAMAAPSAFIGRLKSSLIAAVVSLVIMATVAGVFYAVVHLGGLHIPGPSGTDLFT